MSDITQAADDIRNFARLYKRMVDVAAVVERIGSLDTAATEAQARIDALAAKEAQAHVELGRRAAELADALGQIEAAKKKAEQIELDAMDKAAALIRSADETAADATKGAAEEVAAQRAVVEGLRSEVSAIEALMNQRRQELAALEQRAEELRKFAAAVATA